MKKQPGKIFVLLLCVMIFSAAGASALPNYQLRDVSGERDGHTIAGPQWFATAEEWYQFPGSGWGLRNVTVGGQAPGVTMVTSADLVQDFASIYIDDPLYSGWEDNSTSFDVLGSAALVIKEGRGELNLDFGNDYAHHSPFGPQDAMEDVLLSVPGYTTRVLPGRPQLVPSAAWLNTSLFFQGESPQEYGSRLGYLTFRQSASFDVDFNGYRESIKVPIVVANVFDGLASEPGNELYFDITVSNETDIVTRKKFRWGVDQDATHDLGTFFMIQPAATPWPTHTLISRITNRTGARYRSQRYDNISPTPAYTDISPLYWAYDLTPDLYGTLPAYFELDPQSQIAPGLVTTYISLMDMRYGSSESFRLYPYQGSEAPKDLRLTFRKIGGMTPFGTVSAVVPAGDISPWTAEAFRMTFADVAENEDNTEDDIAEHTGGKPVMPLTYTFTGAASQYFKADAFNSFMISADLPAADVVTSAVASGDVALLPVRVRMRISRQEAPIVGRWNDIANADSVVDAFSQICTIWVRSPNAAELDLNLFTTLANRGYGPAKCVQAFTHDDFLYVDFIVLLADAVSQNTGKTAFCQVIEDDKVPYILIGDGQVDNALTLGFYVAATGSSPQVPSQPQPTPGNNNDPSGGGGCGTVGLGIFALLCLPFLNRYKKMKI